MRRTICIFLLFATLFSLTSCVQKVEWPTSELGKQIPIIEGARGEIDYYSTSLSISLVDITKNQYDDYVASCIARGFTIETEKDETSFSAYNEKGYKLDTHFYSNGNLRISLDAPIQMEEFKWPTTPIAELLPVPDSSYGSLEWSADYGFVLHVGNTTRDDYNDYVEAVKSKGFTVDANSGKDFYYADNSDGYRVTLKYEGFNTMFVRIDDPEEDNELAKDISEAESNSKSEVSIRAETSYEESIHTHIYSDATCESPITCETCGATKGKANEHKWEPATCSAPKTCSICNKTEGEMIDHSWNPATCMSPKQCEFCGRTSGDKATHKYINGVCLNCGAKDPNYVSEKLVWIPTNGGTKYHSRSSCSNMNNPRQVTLDEAIELGFTACARCH